MLVEKGLQNQDIATELNIEILDIQRSISRLRDRGIKKLGYSNRGGKGCKPNKTKN